MKHRQAMIFGYLSATIILITL